MLASEIAALRSLVPGWTDPAEAATLLGLLGFLQRRLDDGLDDPSQFSLEAPWWAAFQHSEQL